MAKTKTITIAGKQVNIAYCYATEIAFYDLTGKEITAFIHQAITKQDVGPKDVMCAVLAAIMAYYQSQGEESPISDHDLMFDANPDELTKAFLEVIAIFSEWYKIPQGEPKPKSKGRQSKN